MKQLSVLSEYVRFLKEQKKYWMIPLVVVFLLLGMLAILLEGSAMAPFIYAIF